MKIDIAITPNATVAGVAYGFRSGSANYNGVAICQDANGIIIASHAAGTPWGPTVPVTWVSGTYIGFSLDYESTS